MKNNLQRNSKNELIEEILKLREENEKLKKENKNLKGKLNTTSQNSSKPPSTNNLWKITQICNSRIKWQNPRWWVKWHKWETLKQFEKPDKVEVIEVKNCEKCAFSLEKISVFKEVKRQVVDIPTPFFNVTEYKNLEKVCPCCKHLNKSKFPEWVEQSIQYWPNIQASSTYMYNHQMTSYERLQEFWKECYWLEISQTTLTNFNQKNYDNLEDFENQMKSALIKSPILNTDETGVRIDWKTSWIHTAWTGKLTYYSVHEKRGKDAMDEMKVLEFFTWILVSDHWKSYQIFSNFLLHCFCNAHHLRELKWVFENEGKDWGKQMIELLLKTKDLKKEAIERWESFLEKEVLEDIHSEFKSILQTWKSTYELVEKKEWKRWRVKKSKWLNLLERLEKNEDWTLWFIHNFDIPFDNNLAERDLRMTKTRVKISWCFRSFNGAKWFCRIRSYISTLRKQGVEIYNSLFSIFSWNLFLPNF